MRHQLGLFFYDKSDGEVKLAVQLYKSAVQLYKSAYMKIELTYIEIHTREFNKWKVCLSFQGKSIGDVKSAVQLYKSADMKSSLVGLTANMSSLQKEFRFYTD